MAYTNDYLTTRWRSLYEEAEKRDFHSRRKLCVTSYENAIVSPKNVAQGGLFAQGRNVPWSRFWHASGNVECPAPSDYKLDDREVCYIGMLYGCWGHCLTDDLRHLWPLVKGLVPSGVKCVFVASGDGEKMPDNLYRLLEAAGIGVGDLMEITEPTQFRKVYFCEPSYWKDSRLGYRQYTDEFVATVNCIKSKFLTGKEIPHRCVYFTRAGWSSYRPDVGEKYLERAFREKYQCEVVRPESLQLGEMIRLMAETKTFVSTECSCQLNSLFMTPGSEVIVLRKSHFIDDCEMLINQAIGLSATIIDANFSILKCWPDQPWCGPFFCYVTPQVGRFLGIKPRFPVIDFMVYLWWFIKMRTRRYLSAVKYALYIKLRRKI